MCGLAVGWYMGLGKAYQEAVENGMMENARGNWVVFAFLVVNAETVMSGSFP